MIPTAGRDPERFLFSCPHLPLLEETLSRRTNSNSWKGQAVSALCMGAGGPRCSSVGLLFPDLGFTSKQFSPCIPHSPLDSKVCLPLTPQLLPFLEPIYVPNTISCIISLNPHNNPVK